MQIAIVGAGYTPGEADQLRRDMAAWRKHRPARAAPRAARSRASRAQGIAREFGEQLYQQIHGFGEYGFPESHAASFALLVYATRVAQGAPPGGVRVRAPQRAADGLLLRRRRSSQDAQRHGVEVRPPCVDRGATGTARSSAERPARRARAAPGPAPDPRLGEARGGGASTRRAREAPFASLRDLVRRAGLEKNDVEALAEAGALAALVPARREALWPRAGAARGRALRGARHRARRGRRPAAAAARSSSSCSTTAAWASRSTTTRWPHLRARLARARRAARRRSCATLRARRRAVTVAGLVIGRQRPGTASGVTFVTLEDETGFVNLIVQRDVFAENYAVARHAQLLLVKGRLERQGEVIHVLAPRARAARAARRRGAAGALARLPLTDGERPRSARGVFLSPRPTPR